MHQGDVLRQVGQVLHVVIHGERDVDDVALLESRPDAVAAGYTAHVAPAPLRVVLGIGVGTGLQLADVQVAGSLQRTV